MTRRRMRSSWGSITEIERGKRYVIRYWANTDERGYRRHCTTVRGTRAEAERRRAELMLEHCTDTPCPTVGSTWDKHVIPDMEQMVRDGDLAASTLRQYLAWWKKHVEPHWGDVLCTNVRPLAIQQWISQLGYSQAKNSMQLLSKVMDYATRFEYVPSNPMREKYMMPSKSTVNRRDDGTWRLDELADVWRKVYGTWMEPAFILAAFGGTRVGETLGPLAGEVKLTRVDNIYVAMVPIVRQVEHHGKVVDRLKNVSSRRTVAIAGAPAKRLAKLASEKDADSFLTDNGFGEHVSQERYSENWRKRGMDHPFRNLRNSWQTWMRWTLRVEPFFIETLMGHINPGTTGRHYDRPTPEQLSKVVAEAWGRHVEAGGTDFSEFV